MKARLNEKGMLIIIPESTTEVYALDQANYQNRTQNFEDCVTIEKLNNKS